MTLSMRAEPHPGHGDILAYHNDFEKPESGVFLRVGIMSSGVNLTSEQARELGLFLIGGHAAVEADKGESAPEG